MVKIFAVFNGELVEVFGEDTDGFVHMREVKTRFRILAKLDYFLQEALFLEQDEIY